MSRISVIIPVYNAESRLKLCLDSVIAQDEPDFECILIDDESTDRSLEICREFAVCDYRFKVISQRNGGPSAARNAGLDVVTSKWVTFIDADDVVEPSYLSNFLKYNCDDESVQVIQSYLCEGYKGIDDDTLYPSSLYSYCEVTQSTGSDFIESRNMLLNWGVWCKVFSMELLRKHNLRFDENLKCGEDGLFWHSYLAYVSKLIFIPEHGYIYFCPRIYDSVSRKNNPNGPTQWLTLTKRYKKLYPLLSKKFKLQKNSRRLLKQLYLNNYFKVLLKSSCSADTLKALQPPKNIFGKNKRDFAFGIINLLPVRISIILRRLINR